MGGVSGRSRASGLCFHVCRWTGITWGTSRRCRRARWWVGSCCRISLPVAVDGAVVVTAVGGVVVTAVDGAVVVTAVGGVRSTATMVAVFVAVEVGLGVSMRTEHVVRGAVEADGG